MLYRKLTYLVHDRMLESYCHCHADEIGNRPCDNGCYCDKCSTDEFKQACTAVLHGAQADLFAFKAGYSYEAKTMYGGIFKITVVYRKGNTIAYYMSDEPGIIHTDDVYFKYVEGKYIELLKAWEYTPDDEDYFYDEEVYNAYYYASDPIDKATKLYDNGDYAVLDGFLVKIFMSSKEYDEYMYSCKTTWGEINDLYAANGLIPVDLVEMNEKLVTEYLIFNGWNIYAINEMLDVFNGEYGDFANVKQVIREHSKH